MKRFWILYAIGLSAVIVLAGPGGSISFPPGSGGGGGSSGTNGNFYNLIVTNNLIIPDNGLGGGTNFVPTLWVNQQMFYGDGQNHYTNGDNTLSYWYSQWVSDSFTFGSRQNAGSVFVYSTNGDFSIAGNLTANSITTPNATIDASGKGTFTDIGNMSWISTGGKIVYAQNANGNLALAGTAVTTIDSFFTGGNQNGSGITNIQSSNIVSTNDFNISAVVLNTLYTNTARTAVWYLDMTLTDAVGGTPALTVTINQGPVTNIFVRSPLVVGIGGTVTNGWAFPLNAGAIYKVQDTSSGTGASVAVKQSVVTKN